MIARRVVHVRTFGTLVVLLVITGCASSNHDYPAASFVDDATITAKIRSRLAGDALLDASGITVNTSNGTVVLSGSAKSTLERNNAENIAMATRGARIVKNEIAVQR